MQACLIGEVIVRVFFFFFGPELPPCVSARNENSGYFAEASFLSSGSCVLLADSPPSPASCPLLSYPTPQLQQLPRQTFKWFLLPATHSHAVRGY